MTRPFVTVVSGLPRSGTSLMMRMLGAGGLPLLTDQVRNPDEDNPCGYFEYEPVMGAAADCSWVACASGKAVKVIHMLLRYLPNEYRYRVIFMQRNIEEVLASQQTMLKRRESSPNPRPTERLASVFLNQVSDAFRRLSQRSDTRVLEVNYNRLMDDPVAAAGYVNEFLDGGMSLREMTNAVIPTLYRQRAETAANNTWFSADKKGRPTS